MSTEGALVPHGDAVSVALLRLASDRRLIEQVQDGSERAFEALFNRHRGPLLRFCERLLSGREGAEDVVQQTFLVAYHDLMRGESPRAPRSWLYGIARHRCQTLLRARRETSIEEAPEPAIDHLVAEVTTRDDLRAILTDVARLPADQRAALVLAQLGDVSYEEIARHVGCPPTKVKALVYQARSTLAASRRARETPCAEIREQLASLRGSALRRASLRHHIRDCAGCRAFRDELRAQRGRLGLLLPIFRIGGLKRVILGAVCDSAGGGAAAVGVGTLSGAGVAATALVTVSIPVAGVAVALTGARDGGAAPRTSPLAGQAAATMYRPVPGPAAPDHARAERHVGEHAQGDANVRDRAVADDRPPPAVASEPDTSQAPPQGGGDGNDSHGSSPDEAASDTSPNAPEPIGAVAPPSAPGRPPPAAPAAPVAPPSAPAQPAPSTSAAPAAPPNAPAQLAPATSAARPEPPTPAAPVGPPGAPARPAPATPEPPKPNPQHTPPSPERDAETTPTSAPANPPAPTAGAAPSPTVTGTPHGDGGDNESKHASSGSADRPAGRR